MNEEMQDAYIAWLTKSPVKKRVDPKDVAVRELGAQGRMRIRRVLRRWSEKACQDYGNGKAGTVSDLVNGTNAKLSFTSGAGPVTISQISDAMQSMGMTLHEHHRK